MFLYHGLTYNQYSLGYGTVWVFGKVWVLVQSGFCPVWVLSSLGYGTVWVMVQSGLWRVWVMAVWVMVESGLRYSLGCGESGKWQSGLW